ncbi:unnamed protein product [Rotaria socialis]|uniref:Uncharacterized protein n=1 Tax=Rotaria socialis TaxID=392032 RepID=A0A820U5J2_9BILA|nr:unnamed protein product [Rotaria socialis]CAF3547479.1 unnamed protein product [Rotaria socialis]CAF3768499.1 unnamed protein product [Rotaria socialis]CAF4123278.1 unnamed protein product [Rotaria socialis]CAF4281116.1 unnamed protein product [Rotaria socialis]
MVDNELFQVDVLEHFNDLPTSKTSSTDHKNTHFNDDLSSYTNTCIDDIEHQTIPTYLLSTDPSFEHCIRMQYMDVANSLDIEKLRAIAIVIHQLKMINLEITLWSTFLKSGTGQFNESHIGPPLWPELFKKRIHSSVRHHHQQQQQQQQDNDTENEIYLKIVRNRLQQLKKREQYYQRKHDEQIQPIHNYHNTMKPFLQTFIQDKLHSLQMDYEHNIALIGYEFEDHRLAYEIQQQQEQQQNLNVHQQQLIENLCHRKYQNEMSKCDFNSLKQLLRQKELPKSLDTIQIVFPVYIQAIDDPRIRQEYLNRHEQIMETYKSEMMILLVYIAEIFMLEIQQLFDDEMAKLWQEQHCLPIKKRFNSIVLNLMEQRFANITKKVQCISQYKLSSLVDESLTL